MLLNYSNYREYALLEPRSDSLSLTADSHPFFLRDDPSLAYNIRRYSNKRVTTGATSTASSSSSSSSKESSSPLPALIGCKPNMFESLFLEAQETAQKEQPSPSTTRSTIEVEPRIIPQIRTNDMTNSTSIGGKTCLMRIIPTEMTTFRQQNPDQFPNCGRCLSVFCVMLACW